MNIRLRHRVGRMPSELAVDVRVGIYANLQLSMVEDRSSNHPLLGYDVGTPTIWVAECVCSLVVSSGVEIDSEDGSVTLVAPEFAGEGDLRPDLELADDELSCRSEVELELESVLAATSMLTSE